jgi:hypothetical protein
MQNSFVNLSNGVCLAYLERGDEVSLVLLYGITDNIPT